MDGSTALWLGLTLAAPLTLVPEVALLRLLHSKRSSWHPLDVLLVSLVVGQLCCTLVALGLSAAALARHAGLFLGHVDVPHHEAGRGEPLGQAPLCAALVSFWAAAHTLHAATLTSMAVDRAMTVRWPYKYRLSVRRTQVRYHVVVLAVVSVLVGVAALFASEGSGRPASAVYPVPTPTPPTVTPPAPTLPALSLDEALAETVSTTDFVPTNAAVDDDGDDGNFAAGETFTPEPLPDGQMMLLVAPAELGCTFLPYMFDSRFSLFWICLHGIFLMGTVTAGAVVVVTRILLACCSGDLIGLAAGSGSDMRTLGHASDGSSATLPMSGHHQPPGQPPRYTAGPCLGGSAVSPAVRAAKPMFASGDKGFASAIHHAEESGKVGKTEFIASPARCWDRRRHSTVVAVLVIAYATHHLPLLVLTTLGTFFGHVLPADWPYSAMALASSLGSSLIVMAVLVIIDPPVHGWMMESLAPSSRRVRRPPFPLDRHHQRSPVTSESATLEQNLAPMKIDDEARYRISQIYSSEPAEAKFPLTNGSLFVHLMNPPSSESGGPRANRRPSRMGVSAYDQRHQRGSNANTLASSTHSSMYLEGSKPPLLTFMSRSRILSLNAMSDGSRIEPLYNDPGEFQQTDEAMNVVLVSSMTASGTVCSTGSSTSTVTASGKYRRNQEPIYASLSETVSSCNTLDSLGARILEQALERDEAQKKALSRSAPLHLDSEDSDSEVGSATESAGDDFEFHNIRTSHQTLISPSDEHTASRPRSRVARSATYRVLCNGMDVKCTKRGENDADVVITNSADGAVPSKLVSKGVVAAASESQHGLVTCVTIQADESLENMPTPLHSSSSLRRSKLLTSLSMNDIDIIGSADESSEERNEFSIGQLSGRSDSLFSLCDENRSAEGQSCSELQLSKLPLDGRRPRKPQRPSIQQHLQQLERYRTVKTAAAATAMAAAATASQSDCLVPAVQMRKKSSRRSRAAVLQRFQDRLHDSGFNTGTSRSSTCNGTPTSTTPSHVKTSHVVSIAALKAALSQSPMSYLDNGDVYPVSSSSLTVAAGAAASSSLSSSSSSSSQSKTVFVSEYI